MIFDFDSLKNQYPEIAERFGDEIIQLIKSMCVTKHAAVVLNSLCLAFAIYCVHKNHLYQIDDALNQNVEEIH